MRKTASGSLLYSPSDLIRYVASPYSSWMDRYFLENPGRLAPDKDSEELKLVARIGDEHEHAVLGEFKAATADLVSIETRDFSAAQAMTLEAVRARKSIIYQGAFSDDRFAGFSDFLQLDEANQYEIWDTKLARSPKPYYAIQLCCYSEMFAATTGEPMPKHFGIILGSNDRVRFRVEDFIHYYRQVRRRFLAMQDGFPGNLGDCPEPLAGADHGRWTSHAESYFEERDHLVRVAGVSVGQIKKLNAAGIITMKGLAAASSVSVPRLAEDSLRRLIAQAQLQCRTLVDRARDPDAPACYEIIGNNEGGQGVVGLAALPPANPTDVFFDMEGYPLAAGGLEYLFGVCSINPDGGGLVFHDWWAHTRDEEKVAFEKFVDWVFARWRENPGMHIYHYAAYEMSALRRLSTRHNTRQEEVDDLLRHEVLVDLYQIVRHGVRIGEADYSIKTIERLYRAGRSTAVATATESIVQYAAWMAAAEPADWKRSPILKGIRDYNEDDCRSTAELVTWLRGVAVRHGIRTTGKARQVDDGGSFQPKETPPEVVRRLQIAEALQAQPDEVSRQLADLMDFHRREEKPMWWRMFDRAAATPDELRDDPGCIEGVRAVGNPIPEKNSLVQTYEFDAAQECKLAAGERTYVMFAHNLQKLALASLDIEAGVLKLKISRKGLVEKFEGRFPPQGSLLADEYVAAVPIQAALSEIGEDQLQGGLCASVRTLISRRAPSVALQKANEGVLAAAVRVCLSMNDDCLVIQGPPGTGKTYTGARIIRALVAAGKTVGVASNSHKAIDNLLVACGAAMRESGYELQGIKVLGDTESPLFQQNRGMRYVPATKDARSVFSQGVAGGTAWLFTRPEWKGSLDYLVLDEAGQVSLANAVAMARCAKNIILLGDQMQLEQPVQGTHPGDSSLSGLQYALKDLAMSKIDEPVFHSVVPSEYGLFLGESRRMHPDVCRFISEAIYEGRLASHPDCGRQRIDLANKPGRLISKECGIAFSSIEHDGNVQQSDEERDRVLAIYRELLGQPYTASDGTTRPLGLNDFLFIAPYNAQVRSLQAALPTDARVGSVDKFQGQEAPVCILSLCSSYGEYGSRGLGFILDRNRVNVAISRAQCLAIVVADPRISNASATSLAEMSLINLLCKTMATGGE